MNQFGAKPKEYFTLSRKYFHTKYVEQSACHLQLQQNHSCRVMETKAKLSSIQPRSEFKFLSIIEKVSFKNDIVNKEIARKASEKRKKMNYTIFHMYCLMRQYIELALQPIFCYFLNATPAISMVVPSIRFIQNFIQYISK